MVNFKVGEEMRNDVLNMSRSATGDREKGTKKIRVPKRNSNPIPKVLSLTSRKNPDCGWSRGSQNLGAKNKGWGFFFIFLIWLHQKLKVSCHFYLRFLFSFLFTSFLFAFSFF